MILPRLQGVESRAERQTDVDQLRQEPFDFDRPWLSARAAAAYVGNKTIKGFYEWRRRHGIVPRANGTVARRDLDRALKAKPRVHRMSPHSLANLRKRSA